MSTIHSSFPTSHTHTPNCRELVSCRVVRPSVRPSVRLTNAYQTRAHAFIRWVKKVSRKLKSFLWFSKIYISHGSVATQLTCAGIFSNSFIANFPQNVPAKKKFENRSIFGEGMEKSLQLTGTFLAHPVFELGEPWVGLIKKHKGILKSKKRWQVIQHKFTDSFAGQTIVTLSLNHAVLAF